MPAPTPVQKRTLFEGHALFGKLPPADLDALLLHARVEHFAAGRTIFTKGSPGRSMMAILKGSIRISAPSPAGPDIVLTILHAGEIFGEIALLDGQDRTADATAMTDCELLVLDHRDFIPFLERRADLCILLLRLLSQRLRQTDRQVEEVMFGRLDARIAKALLRLAQSAPPAGDAISLRITQQELAGMVGATRESVNKQLHVWQSEGMVQLGKRLIVIPDIDAIEALA
ncbi:MAG: Crp/Fnr family transcriptional regulator [Alphaproteobacteria bacterium]|nr:Crp/Fnr family transcriptional regulator [Alphaproteobacteria bacterium]